MIVLESKHRKIITDILHLHVPGVRVLAFGSRVKGTTKPFADIDLAVMTDEPLKSSILTNLHDAFSESDLPFRVDIIDWATTGEQFRNVIKQQFEELYHPE